MFDPRAASWFNAATSSIYTIPAPAGPGFVFAAGGGLVGIDLDKVLDLETGTLAPIALELIARLPGYWEVSPSGTGLKGFFFGALPEGCANRAALPGGGGAIEVYDRGRYFAVTGHAIPGATADLARAEELPALLADYLPAPRPKLVSVPASASPRSPRTRRSSTDPEHVLRRARGYLAGMPGAVAGERGHDRTFKTALALVKGFALTVADAGPLLAEWNAKCSPPWSEYDLQRKLEQATGSRAEVGYLLEREANTSAADATPADQEPRGGCDDLAAEELAALKAAPAPEVEPCPFTARDDIRAALTVSPCPRPYLKTIYRRSTGTHATADFRCGSPLCGECAVEKRRALFDRSADWLIDITGADEPDAPNGRYSLFAAVVSEQSREKLAIAVKRRGGEYCWIRFAGGASVLSPSEKLRQRSKTNAPEEVLWLVTLPVGTDAPKGFAPVCAADVMRLMHTAMSVPQERPEDAERYRHWSHSRDWGYPPEKVRSDDIEFRARSIFNARTVRRMAAELGINSHFSISCDRVNAAPAGWRMGSELHDAIFARLLSGIGATRIPTAERVGDLARDWFAAIPRDLQLTPCVAESLTKLLDAHAWYSPALIAPRIVAQLREAEQADREVSTEASAMLALLRDRYPNPSDAPPVVRALLA